MDSTNWRRKFIRLGLVLTMALSIGLLTACGGGDGGPAQVNPAQVNPTEEKGWDKLVWDTGKWG